MVQEPNARYVVQKNIPEAPGVCTLQLLLLGGTVPPFVPGQFITVYAPNLGTPEGKAYSISSAPHEPTLDITVKEMGKFSRYLCSRKTGDEIQGSLPYGYFYSESNTSTLVMVAAGIGVAPFKSMLLSAVRNHPGRPVALFCSNRTAQDIIFKKTLDELQSAHANLRVFHFLTREDAAAPMQSGRIRAHRILAQLKNEKNLEFMLCGSIAFVRDLWRDLRAAGITEDAIYTEAFFSH